MNEIINRLNALVPSDHAVHSLTHIRVIDGTIIGGDGRVQLHLPYEDFKGMDFTVPGKPFFSALLSCTPDPVIEKTPTKLKVSKGTFKAYLPLLPPDQFFVSPLVPYQEAVDKVFIDILKELMQFSAEDASRPWACGINFDGAYSMATNNIVLARVPLKTPLAFNLSIFTIKTLLRMNESPLGMGVSENSVSFYYADGSAVTSNILDASWPDIEPFFRVLSSNPKPESMNIKVESLLPFCTNKVTYPLYIKDNIISTEKGDLSASCDIAVPTEGVFNGRVLLSVLEKCTHIDLEHYPNPCPFKNDTTNMEGMIMGLRE